MHIWEIPQNHWEKRWCLCKCFRDWVTLTKRKQSNLSPKSLWNFTKSLICLSALATSSSVSLQGYKAHCRDRCMVTILLVGSGLCSSQHQTQTALSLLWGWMWLGFWYTWDFHPLFLFPSNKAKQWRELAGAGCVRRSFYNGNLVNQKPSLPWEEGQGTKWPGQFPQNLSEFCSFC